MDEPGTPRELCLETGPGRAGILAFIEERRPSDGTFY